MKQRGSLPTDGAYNNTKLSKDHPTLTETKMWFHTYCWRFKVQSHSYLLWRNIKANCSQVHLPVVVQARDHEEDARPLGTPGSQAAKPEYDRALILLKVMVIWENITLETHLNHFDHKEEGEWKRGDNHEECADCE